MNFQGVSAMTSQVTASATSNAYLTATGNAATHDSPHTLEPSSHLHLVQNQDSNLPAQIQSTAYGNMRLTTESGTSLQFIEPIPEPNQASIHDLAEKKEISSAYTFARKCAHAATKLDNITAHVHGLDTLRHHKGGAVLVANHHSLTDGLVLMSKLKGEEIHFVIKSELFIAPFKTFLNSIGAVPMIRSGGTGSQDSLAKVKELLLAGKKVCFFPEGTLSPDGALHKGKTGIGRLLVETGADYIPVSIRGPKLRDKAIQVTPFVEKKIDITVGVPITLNSLLTRSQEVSTNKSGNIKNHEEMKQLIANRSPESKEALSNMALTIMHDIQDTLNGDREEGDDGFIPYNNEYIDISTHK
jgi:1-acyl-sn-glycerol-3-phosphate acyltransferase